VWLGENDTGLTLTMVQRPKFYDLATADGVPYEHIARLHGADVLATTVVQTCIRYAESDRCRFCTIEESLRSGATVAAARPAAAKDVSMAGIAGTLGMLAEASGCRAVLDVADIPRPREAAMGDWLTCFPGYAMLTADDADTPPPAGPAVGAVCGQLTEGRGVGLRWPDGEITEAVADTVTGMGAAS